MDTGVAVCRPRPRFRRSHAIFALLALVLIGWRSTAVAREVAVAFNPVELPSIPALGAIKHRGTAENRPLSGALTTRHQFDVRPLLGAVSDLPGAGALINAPRRTSRWESGQWTPATGWLHILSNITIWLAFLIITLSLLYFARRQGNPPFKSLFWLFSALLICSGATRLVEAITFWWPAYELETALKLVKIGRAHV